jgi:hypothetical protein
MGTPMVVNHNVYEVTAMDQSISRMAMSMRRRYRDVVKAEWEASRCAAKEMRRTMKWRRAMPVNEILEGSGKRGDSV